jgi:tetratricopeptide (TPR) repeat protein
MRRTLLIALTLAIAASAARAEEPVAVRVGNHPGFGRVVFDWPAAVGYTVAREGDRILLSFERRGRFETEGISRRLPRPVTSLDAAGTAAEISVITGATLRHYRLGTRIVLDIAPADAARPAASPVRPAPAVPAAASSLAAAPLPLPPPEPPAAAPALAAAPQAGAPAPPRAAVPTAEAPAPVTLADGASPAPAPQAAAARASAEPVRPIESRALVTEAPRPEAQPAPTTPQPAGQAPAVAALAPSGAGPVSLTARAVRNAPHPSVVLPFAATTGFAVLRRGDWVWVVADEARPVDLRPLRADPVFGSAEVAVTPAATVIRVRLPDEAALRLARTERGVRLEVLPEGLPPGNALGAVVREEGGRVGLTVEAPGAAAVVHLSDPDTGERLLIGTLADGEGRVPVGRAYPEFSLMPTLRGVAVLAWSEHVTLRPADNAFALTAGQSMPRGLAITPGQQSVDLSLATRAPTRSFDIPSLSEAALAERLRLLRAETAAAPPLARARPRMMLAETMLALGFGPEAHAMLALAASEDPMAAASPRWAALAGAAALLAGRLDEARAPLSDPRLDGTDEITLWRAWLAEQTGAPAAVTAPKFAAAAPLLPAYPLPLARRIAPAAAEAMLEGGEVEVADALLARLGELPELALARAMLVEARGRIDEALAAYEALDRLRDRRQRVRALARAVELALREGRIGAPEAAARLEPLLYAWRGDAAERALRLRAAELRAQSGDWPGALLLLRETASLFPDRADDIRARLVEAFAALFRDGAADTLPPVEAIALFEENADLLPPGQAGDEMVARLAERLVALDLTARAAVTLRRLMDSQPERGIDRARTGVRLARLKLADRDAAGALEVLDASEPHRPPPALAAERLVLRARAMAARGDSTAARALLARSEDPLALDARAELAAQAGDWKDALAALQLLARRSLPAPGNPLDADQRRLLLRLAVAASLSGDPETLSGLARDHGAAMATGPLSEPFRLLTGGPVRGASDLPRVSAELQLAREMPRILATLATAPRD